MNCFQCLIGTLPFLKKVELLVLCHFFIAECDVETLAAEIEDGIFSNQLRIICHFFQI